MKRNWIALIALGAAAGFVASAVADDDHDNGRQRVFRAKLVGYNEVLSVSTPAKGQFYAILNKEGTGFTYWLTFSGLTTTVSQSHIHFGQHHQNGGISVWLCQGTVAAPPAAGDVPSCNGPTSSGGPIVGTIVASEVIGPAGQGIAPGEFAELLAAMRDGAAYVNVHSGSPGPPVVGFPGGEIRGQVQ
jgi:hypothetical protein